MSRILSTLAGLLFLVCSGVAAAAGPGYNEYYPDTIIVRTAERTLYYIDPSGGMVSYRVAVGAAGMAWKGSASVQMMREWPSWNPPKEMIARKARQGIYLADHVPGGLNNPLGAAALYLFKDGRDTLYRIHGTNEPWSIGRAVSSGCIRMHNADIQDLYARVGIGTRVVVE